MADDEGTKKFFLVGLGMLLLVVMLDFNDVFIIFHELLFQNRDWIFDPRQDPVINVLPDQYFFLVVF